jgi:sucrose phosphorylase
VVVNIPKSIPLPLCDLITTNCINFLYEDKEQLSRELTLEPYQIMWLKGKINETK